MGRISITVNNADIVLTDREFLSSGGEGDVYKKNGLIYKLYQNKPSFDLVAKGRELANLQRDNILRPLDIIYVQNKANGFTMKFADNCTSLPQVFTNSFQNRNNIQYKSLINLSNNLAETIQYIHDCNILIVDCNEFNFMVDKKSFEKIYCIDVDSYQTKSFPATAIMPSIQDFHSKEFSETTDWYSYGILVCQIVLGIHPYRGKFTQDPKMKMIERMKKNISIFNKDVSIPKTVRDFLYLPDDLHKWMIDVFEKGKRVAPPLIKGVAVPSPTMQRIVSSSSIIKHTLEFTGETHIDRVENINGVLAIFCNSKLIYGKNTYNNVDKHAQLYFKDGDLHSVQNVKGKLHIINLKSSTNILNNEVYCGKIQVIGNRIYSLNDSKFSEINIAVIGNKCLATTSHSRDILPNATTMYRNCLYMDMLGVPTMVLPYDKNLCTYLSLKDLKGHKIIDAKYEDGFMQIISFANGEYYEHFLRFTKTHDIKSIITRSDITVAETNFIVLPNGIVLSLNAKDELTITTVVDVKEKVIVNSGLNGAVLCSEGKPGIIVDDKIYSITMN